MSSLRSVVDEFAVEDLGRLEDRQLEDDLVEIDLQMTRLGAQRSRRLAVVDQRGSYSDHGYLSTTAWLACPVQHFRAGGDGAVGPGAGFVFDAGYWGGGCGW